MRELTAEIIVDALVPDEVRVSPDGSRVAFAVRSRGQSVEHASSAVWVAPTDGRSGATKLTSGTAEDRAPRWSASGDTLIFLSDRAKRGIAQIHRIPLGGGEAEACSDWEPGIAEAIPLPSGETVAFLAVDSETAEKKERKERRDDAEVYGERWRYQRLRLLDLASREVTTIEALGDRHVTEIASSSDGARIAVLAWPTPEEDNWARNAEVWLVEVATPAAARVCALPTGGANLAWGTDDELLFLAHQAPDMRGGVAVFSVPATGGTPRRAARDLMACPTVLATDADGSAFVLVAQGLDSWIGRLDPASGEIERLTDLPGGAWALDVSRGGRTVAVCRSLPTDQANVWAGAMGGDLRRLTDLNPEQRDLPVGAQERLSWDAADGLIIEGLLVLPAGASREDAPFPLMTLVHGGPYGRYEDSFQLSWMRWGQWLAAVGYAVLLPNPRGGMGRGHDFADRVAGTVGQEDWADVQAGIDHLVARGVADPERLGIGGWSQGGFMTAWAVGQTARFKLGIMGAGVSDWGMMVATSDLPHFEAMLGGSTGWEGPGPHRHDALSPISYAHRVATPMLILHGADDERVPVSQGRFFARALRELGVANELVVYPREGHLIRERNHQIDLLRRVRDWVSRWLGPGWARRTDGGQDEPGASVQAS